MADGRTHFRVALLGDVALVGVSVYLASQGDSEAAGGLLVGAAIGTIVTPDFDLQGTTYTERLLRVIPGVGRAIQATWYPYAMYSKHRGMSHWHLIGTLSRVLYLFLAINFWVVWLNGLSMSFGGKQLLPVGIYLPSVIEAYPRGVLFTLIAWFIHDELHLWLDWKPRKRRRSKRKGITMEVFGKQVKPAYAFAAIAIATVLVLFASGQAYAQGEIGDPATWVTSYFYFDNDGSGDPSAGDSFYANKDVLFYENCDSTNEPIVKQTGNDGVLAINLITSNDWCYVASYCDGACWRGVGKANFAEGDDTFDIYVGLRKLEAAGTRSYMPLAILHEDTVAQAAEADTSTSIFMPLFPSCTGIRYTVTSPIDKLIIQADGIRKIRWYADVYNNGDLIQRGIFWCADLSEQCSREKPCMFQVIADDPFSAKCWKSRIVQDYWGIGVVNLTLDYSVLEPCTPDIVLP